MEIFVDYNELLNCIEKFKNNNKIIEINGNVFKTKYISTLLNTKEETEKDCGTIYSFSFSYNDNTFSNMIDIVYKSENYSCIDYVKNCKCISDDLIDSIIQKSVSVVSKRHENDSELFSINEIKEIDDVFYNEVLVLISSKINEVDKESTKDDFSSKYNLYKSNKIELTKKTYNLLKEFYNLIKDSIVD